MSAVAWTQPRILLPWRAVLMWLWLVPSASAQVVPVRAEVEFLPVQCSWDGTDLALVRIEARIRVINVGAESVLFFSAAKVGRVALARNLDDFRAGRYALSTDYDLIWPEIAFPNFPQLSASSPEFSVLQPGDSVILEREAFITLLAGQLSDGAYVASLRLLTWPSLGVDPAAFTRRTGWTGTLFADGYLMTEPTHLALACGRR